MKRMHRGNLFQALPDAPLREEFTELFAADGVRIERIVSKGHASPECGWYDQHEHEWVTVLQGSGTILFETGEEVNLAAGDYVHIPAGTRHKVTRTDRRTVTIWLAVFYR